MVPKALRLLGLLSTNKGTVPALEPCLFILLVNLLFIYLNFTHLCRHIYDNPPDLASRILRLQMPPLKYLQPKLPVANTTEVAISLQDEY